MTISDYEVELKDKLSKAIPNLYKLLTISSNDLEIAIMIENLTIATILILEDKLIVECIESLDKSFTFGNTMIYDGGCDNPDSLNDLINALEKFKNKLGRLKKYGEDLVSFQSHSVILEESSKENYRITLSLTETGFILILNYDEDSSINFKTLNLINNLQNRIDCKILLVSENDLEHSKSF